jgi:hypothetical protein
MSIPTITVVHTRACHLCVDALDTLTALGDDVQLATHRPTMFPLVLVDGSFFSQGRLPRHKVRALLSSRLAASPR